MSSMCKLYNDLRHMSSAQIIQDVFQSVLSAEGCSVALARDGASMRQVCAASAFDVVILDVALPGGESGLQLAREAALAGCGVILVTGHHAHYDAVAQSGYRHLFKPFRVEALLRAIQELLAERRARGALKGRGGAS